MSTLSKSPKDSSNTKNNDEVKKSVNDCILENKKIAESDEYAGLDSRNRMSKIEESLFKHHKKVKDLIDFEIFSIFVLMGQFSNENLMGFGKTDENGGISIELS